MGVTTELWVAVMSTKKKQPEIPQWRPSWVGASVGQISSNFLAWTSTGPSTYINYKVVTRSDSILFFAHVHPCVWDQPCFFDPGLWLFEEIILSVEDGHPWLYTQQLRYDLGLAAAVVEEIRGTSEVFLGGSLQETRLLSWKLEPSYMLVILIILIYYHDNSELFRIAVGYLKILEILASLIPGSHGIPTWKGGNKWRTLRTILKIWLKPRISRLFQVVIYWGIHPFNIWNIHLTKAWNSLW